MNILEESQLLKQSKDQLVEVLQNHGFAVTADTPLADVAKYMKWDGGLLDLRVATLRKTNGEYNAYSQEEWSAISSSTVRSNASLSYITPTKTESKAPDKNISKNSLSLSM